MLLDQVRFHLQQLAATNKREMRSNFAYNPTRNLRFAGIALLLLGINGFCEIGSISFQNELLAQKSSKKYPRVAPPNLTDQDFSGVFYENAIEQLQGDRPDASQADASTAGSRNQGSEAGKMQSDQPSDGSADDASGTGIGWKRLISSTSIEDLVKESKQRLDQAVTTPAKFASGGFKEARREFTLLATLMAIIDQYEEQIRWKNSANYAQRVFAKVAANSVVGTPPVLNEAKLRQQDLQELLKGSKLEGTAEEVTWEQTADRGPLMQILEWALRSNLSPKTSNDKEFENSQDEILKYAELVAAYGEVLQKSGMTDADDESYSQMAKEMSSAASELVKAVQLNNSENARAAVGRIDQSCSKCHEAYR